MNDSSLLGRLNLPVTIITGFLGSGKTTLLNYILQNRQDLKVAVLVNELGNINIDAQLLVSVEEDSIMLSNGCICCSINGSLVEAVYGIFDRSDRFDHLLIETSGVADPLPILMTFLGTALRDLTSIDSILTVVDASTFTINDLESKVAFNQIAYGDIILLNKTDLVSSEQLKYLEDYIHTVKLRARILPTHYGNVPLSIILDVGGFQPELLLNQVIVHSKTIKADGFMSVSFESDRPFILEKFQVLIDQLPDTIYRGKGILWFRESRLRHIFQLTGKRCEFKTDTSPLTGNQLVLIGRNLNTSQLQEQLTNCLG